MVAYPNRIHVVGAHKAGTTKLYECLAGHPMIYGSIPKQTLYFYERMLGRVDIAEYLKHIGYEKRNEKWVVDSTPDHFFNFRCINKISELPGECLFLVSLRNPIDRAYSHWAMTQGDKRKGEFLSLMHNRDQRVSSIIQRSRYGDQLANIFENAPRDNVLVHIFEEWTANPALFFESIKKHCGLDLTNFWALASQNHRYQSSVVNRLAKVYKKTPLRNILSPRVRVTIRNFAVNIGSGGGLSEEERAGLAPIFRDDVAITSNLLRREISAWQDF